MKVREKQKEMLSEDFERGTAKKKKKSFTIKIIYLDCGQINQ